MAMKLFPAVLVTCAVAIAPVQAQEELRLPTEPVLSEGSYTGNWVGEWVTPKIYHGRWEGTYNAGSDLPVVETEIPAERVILRRSVTGERYGDYFPVEYGPRERAEWLAQCEAIYGGEYAGGRDIYRADYCEAYLARYERSFAGSEYGYDPDYGLVRWVRVPIRRGPIPSSASYDEMVTRTVTPNEP